MKSFFLRLSTLVFLLSFAFGSVALAQSTPKTDKAEVQKQKIKTAELAVEGMVCQMGCADGIDRKLKKTEGIIKSKTLLETGICTVTYDENIISLNQIVKIIKKHGYESKPIASKN
ncbi:MAG: heavy-metal-associated domain-containing protein [Saprospiraceae bacterium]|nr:MAG: copper chaperone [Bacteroidetes bacterium OLB9]MCO6463629.1 heavy-metal-associated domain-containing protein [Saprospiraceae bacterium]